MSEFEQKIQDAIDGGDTKESSPERSRSEKLRLLLNLDHHNDHLRAPFAIEVGDPKRRFVVRCDGCMLLAIESDEAAVTLEELDRNMIPYMTRAVGDEPPFKLGSVIRSSVAELLAWTGEPIWGERCDACLGEGRLNNPAVCSVCDGEGELQCHCSECGDSHTRSCSTCDGSGESPDEVVMVDCHDCSARGWRVGKETQTGYVGRTCLDMRRLARLVSPVEGKCLVWSYERETNALAVRGERGDWHALLMGMTDGEYTSAPRFGPAKGDGNYHYCPFCQVTHTIGDHLKP